MAQGKSSFYCDRNSSKVQSRLFQNKHFIKKKLSVILVEQLNVSLVFEEKGGCSHAWLGSWEESLALTGRISLG